jgi:cytochrome c oxidase subunit II
MRRLRRAAGVLFALLLMRALPAAEGVPAGYEYCTLCHGATGGGNVAILAPALAGIEPWYLAEQLQGYRARHRGKDFGTDAAGTEMRVVTNGIRPEEADAIAAYLSRLPVVKPPATVTGDARRGKPLYAAHCAACHGPRAEGNAALHAPSLARLNDWYLVASFRKYQSGLRGTDPADTWAHAMHLQSRALPPDFAIEDVARFIGTLKP